MFVRSHGAMQRNCYHDHNRIYPLCPKTGGVPALSHALPGAEARGKGDPGTGRGAAVVVCGDVDPDFGGVWQTSSAVSQRNGEHTSENHRRPFPGCQEGKLHLHHKLCKMCTRFVAPVVVFFLLMRSVAMVTGPACANFTVSCIMWQEYCSVYVLNSRFLHPITCPNCNFNVLSQFVSMTDFKSFLLLFLNTSKLLDLKSTIYYQIFL